ncbi:MAG: L-lactate permease [Candidatus Saccharibacteria bacterium]|nr:L-lactate permease [Candidatus Saccharibacteria bacterium]
MIGIALLAIIVPLVTVVGLRMPARIGMTVSAVVVAVAAYVAWQMPPLHIAASAVQAVHRALTIGLILLGAVTLLRTLQATGAMDRIKAGFSVISADMRVQTVLVAFAFVSLLEGVSGFGTPAIVAAPLLLVLGFRPMTAAVLALLGDTIGCTFGAVGTPLIVGLENISQYSGDLVQQVGAQVTVIDMVIGVVLPVLLVAVLVLQDGGNKGRAAWRDIMAVAPWAMMVGAVYVVSAFSVIRLIGPEFAAILSGAAALVVGMATARRGWLVPKAVWRQAADDAPKATAASHKRPAQQMSLWRAWLPYGVMIGLLLLTRSVPVVKQATQQLQLSLHDIFGVAGISSEWPVLYSPGVVLLLAAAVAALVGGSWPSFGRAARSSVVAVIGALSALVPTLIMVQIFSNSGLHGALPSMPVVIGQGLAQAFGEVWMSVAPVLAAIGAFIAGSATVSTLTMGPVQESIATMAGLPLVGVLALHMVGAAAGNIIAIHNVVSASTVVGLRHQEGAIIRRLIAPFAVYLGTAMAVGAVMLLWHHLR